MRDLVTMALSQIFVWRRFEVSDPVGGVIRRPGRRTVRPA